MAFDKETQDLDREILAFIRRSAADRATYPEFDALALKLFAYQFHRNAVYEKFCRLEKKFPGGLRSWREIPAMPADGFKELVLATFPVKRSVKVFKTSGTTGQRPGVHFFDTLSLYEAAILPPFRRYLMPDGGDFMFCFLVSSPKESPNSSLSHMMGVVQKQWVKGRGRFYVRSGQFLHDRLYQDLKVTGQRVFLLATAFSLKSFLGHLKDNGLSLRLRKGSRLMETGGFKGRAREISKRSFYAECHARLGIAPDHCVSEYGMTELSSQFYDTTLHDKFRGIRRRPCKAGPAWTRTLIIDPKTGREIHGNETGLLRHFDLANRGSVLAIQTEDLGRRTGEGFELLGRASGAEIRGCSLNYEKFLSS